MSSKRKYFVRNLMGCGCSTRPNLRDVYKPKPKPKSKPGPEPEPKPNTSSPSSDGKTSTTFSPAQYFSDGPGPSWPNEKPPEKIGGGGGDSTVAAAVVVESEDPYGDFRDSMMQMVFEKQMFSPENLNHLLHCFLRLNSSGHHDVILRAFMDVCNAVIDHHPVMNL